MNHQHTTIHSDTEPLSSLRYVHQATHNLVLCGRKRIHRKNERWIIVLQTAQSRTTVLYHKLLATVASQNGFHTPSSSCLPTRSLGSLVTPLSPIIRHCLDSRPLCNHPIPHTALPADTHAFDMRYQQQRNPNCPS